MTPTITAQQRDVLIREMALNMDGEVSDIPVLVNNGRWAEAREVCERIYARVCLNEALDWMAVMEEPFTLTIDKDQLALLLRHSLEMVKDHDYGNYRPEDRARIADEDLDVMHACRTVLEQLEAVA